MLYWVLLCSFCAVLSTLPLVSSNNANPLILALPIRIQANYPYQVPNEDSEPEDSEEETEPQEEEQRVVTRNYDPEVVQGKQHRRPVPEDVQPSSPQPGFLTWNPGQNMMILRINDFISVKNEDDGGSEESDNFEEPPPEPPPMPLPEFPFPEQPLGNWPHQGTFDFEDYTRFSADGDNLPGYVPDGAALGDTPLKSLQSVPERSSKRGKKRKKSKRNRVSGLSDGGTVYGTDPVVHFTRNRSRNAERSYGHRDAPRDPYDFRDWWN